MALKALDQRLANSSSPPNSLSTAGPSQVTRSSSANQPLEQSAASNARSVDRKKSASELELAESGKAGLENR
jgi:hypothetical protein